ncbi:hypothetical protein GGI20_003720 [Coemansia sp. BCRC 34301]|nr:hypothetical protein GGI20_003720 [Coemansia sp. BCRC 34301]
MGHLGLSLLDFGYSERTVHDSLPSPSSPESAASGPPSPSPPTSSLSSPLEQVVYEQMGLGLSENCPHYTIDLLDCKLTNGGSGYYPDSHILATPSPAPPRLNLWTSIVCTLGAPEPVCAAAVSVCAPATTPEDGDKLSPFVICGIDDLLLELGVTGSALIPNDLLLSPPTIPMFSADADVLSLREIDELIEQLGHSHASSCIGCLDYCGQPRGMSPSLDIAALGSSLGCVTDIAATLPTDNKALASLLVDPAAIVAELGCAGALVLFLPPASTLNIDCIIRQLGDVSIAAQLVPLPQPRKHAPALGVVGLVCELGEAIEPKYSCPCLLEEEPLAPLLDIAKMVEMLGSPIDVVRVALLQTTAAARFSLAKGLMRTPEPGTAVSLAGLGGVYTSEWLVHDMEQVHKQTIVDTLAAYSFLEFPHIPPQCSAPALGESRMSLELAGTGMDVDEAIFDTRSRSSSMSLEHPDSAQYINRLIAALRIPPIVVSRPFLGPRRNMLFPRLC